METKSLRLSEVKSEILHKNTEFLIPFVGLFINNSSPGRIYGEYFNTDYGRTLYLGEIEHPILRHLFLKGAGWNKGSIPFGEADWGMELHLGLIPLHEAAWREWVVSIISMTMNSSPPGPYRSVSCMS